MSAKSSFCILLSSILLVHVHVYYVCYSVNVYYNFSIHPLNNFWIVSSFLTIINKTTIHIHVRFLCGHMSSFSLG